MADKKSELAEMCRLEIRRTSVLAKSRLSDYGYHFVESLFDSEFWSMIPRLAGKQVNETDMPLLRELIMEDLWPRLREAHKQHRDHVFEAVKSMSRGTISAEASFAFDIGWRSLLQLAVDRVKTYPQAWGMKIVGGKEKLGCLVLHVDYDGDERGARSESERLREEIRLRSLATCDICGESGRLRLSSIAKTVCDKHAAVLGEMREDDGEWSDPYRWREEQPLSEHIDNVVATGRAIMKAVNGAPRDTEPTEATENPWSGAVDMKLLAGMERPKPRPAHHHDAFDPFRETALGRRIDDDTWQMSGREQELLIEFAYYIEDAVKGAVVKEQYLDKSVADEIAHWDEYSAVPLSQSDREWLHGYVRGLIDEEYERIRLKQAAERKRD